MENFGGLNWKGPILKIFERDFSWLLNRRVTVAFFREAKLELELTSKVQ